MPAAQNDESGERSPEADHVRFDVKREDEPLWQALGRVGALGRYLEPERCLSLIELGDDFVRLEEPGFSWLGPRQEALLRLQGLPATTGARYQEVFRPQRRSPDRP